MNDADLFHPNKYRMLKLNSESEIITFLTFSSITFGACNNTQAADFSAKTLDFIVLLV